MSILWFLVIGLVAGWLAAELTRGSGFGLVGNLIVGVIGSLLGGYLFGLFGVNTYGLLGDLVMATLGSVIFLFVLSLFRRTV